MGFGVSACATCDGFFFKDKIVAVAGGGNTAVEEALFLSNLCKKVLIIHRRDKFRAEKILQDRLMKKKNIEILWNQEVKKVIGDKEKKCMTGIEVLNNINNTKEEINVDGFFVAIGHAPATTLFRSKVNMDEEGYIITSPDSTKTNIDGVFFCR